MQFLIISIISLLSAQIVPFETSYLRGDYSAIVSNFLKLEVVDINNSTDIGLDSFFNNYNEEFNTVSECLITLNSNHTIDFIISYDLIPEGSKIFLFDLDDQEIVGPFQPEINSNRLLVGPIKASNFVFQLISPVQSNSYDYNIRITSFINKELQINQDNKKYYPNLNREEPLIVVTGFWPPTNEMIRHFSQSLDLNPSGWEGENWQNSGYDVISFFPEFDDPDCNNCGQGYGNFEVDYQDTSYDFWTLIDELNPMAVITFSRGYIDYSWELEYNFYNRTNWYADYTTPFFPTPNPPDFNEVTMFLRNSNLPMQNIVDAVNSSELGLNSYIDINGDPGHFVSEFMGYHGVWYRDLNQFEDAPCYLAGHVHVGGLIDWQTSIQATEITISQVINALEEYVYTPGDVNGDQEINVLDIVLVVSHVLGNDILEGGAYYAADMNSDGIINIQDIIFIINLII